MSFDWIAFLVSFLLTLFALAVGSDWFSRTSPGRWFRTLFNNIVDVLTRVLHRKDPYRMTTQEEVGQRTWTAPDLSVTIREPELNQAIDRFLDLDWADCPYGAEAEHDPVARLAAMASFIGLACGHSMEKTHALTRNHWFRHIVESALLVAEDEQARRKAEQS